MLLLMLVLMLNADVGAGVGVGAGASIGVGVGAGASIGVGAGDGVVDGVDVFVDIFGRGTSFRWIGISSSDRKPDLEVVLLKIETECLDVGGHFMSQLDPFATNADFCGGIMAGKKQEMVTHD